MSLIDPVTQFVVLDNSNPNNVISAFAGSYLYRDGQNFTIQLPNAAGPSPISVSLRAIAYKNYNDAWYPGIQDFRITFVNDSEIWYKATGTGNAGWQFIAANLNFSPSFALDLGPPGEEVLLEDGTIILLEDGTGMLLEDPYDLALFEDLTPIYLEDGENMLLEDSIEA
jgi:hypothetical protein